MYSLNYLLNKPILCHLNDFLRYKTNIKQDHNYQDYRYQFGLFMKCPQFFFA